MLLTVIIPHYNNATLLERCVKSLLAAEMGDELQIVVVDDGSSSSQQLQVSHMLERLGDTCIQLVKNSVNRGASSARNRGLLTAKGRFVWFVDSDDEVDGELLRQWWPRLVAVDEGVEMIHLGAMRMGKRRYRAQSPVGNETEGCEEVTPEEIMLPRSHCLDHTTYWISRNFLKHNPEIRYKEDVVILEDSIFILLLLDRAKRMVAAHDCRLYIRNEEVHSMTAGVWSREKSVRFMPCIFFFFTKLSAFMVRHGSPQHLFNLYHRYCYVYMRVLAVKGVPVAIYRDRFYNPFIRFGFFPRNLRELLLKSTIIHAIISITCRIIRKSRS